MQYLGVFAKLTSRTNLLRALIKQFQSIAKLLKSFYRAVAKLSLLNQIQLSLQHQQQLSSTSIFVSKSHSSKVYKTAMSLIVSIKLARPENDRTRIRWKKEKYFFQKILLVCSEYVGGPSPTSCSTPTHPPTGPPATAVEVIQRYTPLSPHSHLERSIIIIFWTQ